MKELLINLIDHLSIAVYGHSYRWLRTQREWIARLQAEDKLKARLCRNVVERLRADLAAPDKAGW